MRTRSFSVISALAGSTLLLLLPLAPAALAATGTTEAGNALKEGPVYVAPEARGQLSRTDQDALAKKIEEADKPLFVAVLPRNEEFPARTVRQNLRNATGVTGVYAVRLGDGFEAGADPRALPYRSLRNLVAAAKTPAGLGAATQLNTFVDQALPQVKGHAPASWEGGADDGVNTGALVGVGAVVLVAGAGGYALVRRNRNRKEAERLEALRKLTVVVDEDITAYGEELDRLDFHPAEPGATDGMRTDYQRALDLYETAKSRMASVREPNDVRAVTEALEDGRYALAVLDARRTGRPVPERRSPCFFDPRHGPSVTDATWTPPGGAAREVPVCAADATRLADGQDPAVRTVDTADGRRPYYDAGPAYGPWAGGYFGGGMLPGLLMGTMLGSMLATPAYASDYGAGTGFDTAGAGFEGGDVSGSDFDPSAFGGGDFGGGSF